MESVVFNALIQKDGQQQLIMKALVRKYNEKDKKIQMLALLLTDKFCYHVHPYKHKVKQKIKLEDISGISKSPMGDGLFMLHVKSLRDYLFEYVKRDELISALTAAYAAKANQQLKITIGLELPYTSKGKTMMLVIEPKDSETTKITKMSNGTHALVSMMKAAETLDDANDAYRGKKARRRATVNKDSTLPIGDQLQLANTDFLQRETAQGDKQIIASISVRKLGQTLYYTNDKVMVITDKALYNCSVEVGNLVKRRIELEKISSIYVSSMQDDSFMIQVESEFDYFYNSPQKTQIINAILAQYKAATQKDLTVHVANCFPFRRSPKQLRHIDFYEDSENHWLFIEQTSLGFLVRVCCTSAQYGAMSRKNTARGIQRTKSSNAVNASGNPKPFLVGSYNNDISLVEKSNPDTSTIDPTITGSLPSHNHIDADSDAGELGTSNPNQHVINTETEAVAESSQNSGIEVSNNKPEHFVKDYLNLAEDDILVKVFAANEDKQLHFSGYVQKVGKNFKKKQRAVVISDKHLYIITDVELVAVRKKIKLENIEKLCHANFADGHFIMLMANYPKDYFFESDQKLDIVSAIQSLNKGRTAVAAVSEINYRNTRSGLTHVSFTLDTTNQQAGSLKFSNQKLQVTGCSIWLETVAVHTIEPNESTTTLYLLNEGIPLLFPRGTKYKSELRFHVNQTLTKPCLLETLATSRQTSETKLELRDLVARPQPYVVVMPERQVTNSDFSRTKVKLSLLDPNNKKKPLAFVEFLYTVR